MLYTAFTSWIIFISADVTSESDSEDSSIQTVPQQTLTETVLPWKRDVNTDGSPESVNYVQRQQAFPTWIENRDYLIHGSPSNTLISRLGSATKRVSAPAVFDIFGESPERENVNDLKMRRSSTSDDVEDRFKSTRIDMDKTSPKDVVIEIKINGKSQSEVTLNGETSEDDDYESQATRL